MRSSLRVKPGWFFGSVAVLVIAGVLGGMLTSLFLSLSDDVSALQQQVLSLGEEPAVPTAGAPSPNDGDDGSDGADGTSGRDGRDGLTIVGPPGANGSDGPPGAAGAAGADGLDGATGGQGPAGEPGAQGPPGQSVMGPQGPTGADGQAGPAVGSFTFVAADVTYTCSDPDGDLAYACTQEMSP